MKAVYSCLFHVKWFLQGAVVNGFLRFCVLHTLIRVQPDCVEEKGYTVSVKARSNYSQQSVVLV